jgi:hypothetical protein
MKNFHQPLIKEKVLKPQIFNFDVGFHYCPPCDQFIEKGR